MTRNRLHDDPARRALIRAAVVPRAGFDQDVEAIRRRNESRELAQEFVEATTRLGESAPQPAK